METTQRFEGWFVVEQMGHKRLAGWVQEVTVAGAGFLRVDVPGDGEDLKVSQFILPSTIYCLTPTTEEIVRTLAKNMQIRPPGLLQIERPQLSYEYDDEEEDFDD